MLAFVVVVAIALGAVRRRRATAGWPTEWDLMDAIVAVVAIGLAMTSETYSDFVAWGAKPASNGIVLAAIIYLPSWHLHSLEKGLHAVSLRQTFHVKAACTFR